MANVTIYMADNFMSDNDIVVRIATDVPSLTYEILGALDNVVFGGLVSTINNEIELNLKGLFSPLLKNNYFSNYTINFYDNKSKVAEKEFTVFKGRMSSKMLGDKNLFTDFLFNKKANFLFTNRSFDNLMFVPETEISPFFYHIDTIGFLKVKNGDDVVPLPEHGIIDVETIRKYFFDNFGRLVSVFEILDAETDVVAFSIVVTKAKYTRYKLKFKNAFSCFELLALDDYLKFDITTMSNQAIKYKSSDAKSMIFEYDKKAKMSAFGSVSNRLSDFAFLSDVLSSTETFLVFGKEEHPVRLSLEQPFSFVTDTKINPLQLKMDFLKPLDLNDFLTMPRVGIFSEVFNEIFY